MPDVAGFPLTTPLSIFPAVPLHELLNIAHWRPFSLLFSNYSWMMGAAGGLTVIWGIYVLIGKRSGVEYSFAMPLAAAFTVGAFLNVLSEVEQPSRILYGYFSGWQYWDTAVIKYGIILLPLYLVLCWWLTFQAMDRGALGAAVKRLATPWRQLADLFSLWSRHYSVLEATGPRRWVLGVLIFLSIFAPTYSGLFLLNEHGVAIWNSPAQPLVFMATAVAKGALIMLVVLPALARLAGWRGAESRTAPLRLIAASAIGVYAVLWFGWIWWMGRFGTIEDLRAAALYMGPWGGAIFWNWVVAGVFVPLVLLVSPLGRKRWAQLVALLGVFWGSYAVRFFIAVGGQALVRSGAGYQAFTPTARMLWQTGFSLLALIGVLAVLLLALPADRAVRSESSSGR
jgi:formate-dependent nitrite reductase membrane component NrfD